MSASRIWLITGSSSGFGHETVIQALESGDEVVATLHKPAALDDITKNDPSDRLRVVKLDVTKPAEVDAAFAQANLKVAFCRIDIVFNNAGYVAVGENEAVPDEVSRPLFEVNFWGVVHVSQRVVRFFREENKPQGGLLLQNSAMVGLRLAGVPVIGFYSATKHGLPKRVAAKELDPAWNIKVAIIEPGAFKTSVFNLDTSMVMVPQHPAYANSALPIYNFRGASLKGAGKEADTPADLAPADALLAVAKIIEFSRLSSPPLHFPLGNLKDSIGLVREKIRALTEEIDRYESWSNNKRLRVVKLDVTKPEEIDAAFAQANAAFGRVDMKVAFCRIDIVCNNAGYVAVGENEAVPDEVPRPLFEDHFWGTVHMSQRAARVLTEQWSWNAN